MNKIDLKNFVEQNPKLVTMRESVRYPGLFVLKYHRRVFFDGLWNDYLEECRGTVVDRDFNVIVRPFTKIYNHGVEARSPKFEPNEVVTAYDKVNGFMASVTTYKGELLVSTTGSLDSDFAKMAEEMILTTANVDRIRGLCDQGEFTLMFEVCHPDDPHIIPEKAGLYYLGYRRNSWGSDMWHMAYSTTPNQMIVDARWMGVKPVPSYSRTTVAELEEAMKTSQREGVVFYHIDGRAAKIKTPYYLVKKFVARNPRTDKLLTPRAYEIVEEEYYPLIDHIRANIDEFTALTEQDRLEWVRDYLVTS
jgi:hypothetical protein